MFTCKNALVAPLIILVFASFILADDFPLRAKFKTTTPISTDELVKIYDEVPIIDVRSDLEYNVIHITKAVKISYGNTSFIPDLMKYVNNDKTKKIVFYCNGIECAKSYEAAELAINAGFTNGLVYDAGIPEWASKHPEKTILMGKALTDPKKLISHEQFKQHVLPLAEFKEKIKEPNAFLIDVRDPVQRKKIPDFAAKAPNFPFDKFIKNLDNPDFKNNMQGKVMYLFDAVGKQTQWLQYHLVEKGYKDYYFLDKGALAVFPE